MSRFPTLTDGRFFKQSQNVTSIPLSHVSGISEFCCSQETRVSDLLRLTWAVILSRFSGSEHVEFGFRCSYDDGCTQKDVMHLVDCGASEPLMRVLKRSRTAVPAIDRLVDTSLLVQCVKVNPRNQYSGRGDQHTCSADNPARPPVTKEVNPEFTLHFDIDEDEEEILSGVISYAADRLSDQQAVHLAHTFSHILGAIIARPDSTVGELDLMSERDMQQIQIWNADLPKRVERCVNDLIVQRCLNQPEKPAISSWDGDVDYRELHEQSSQLAHHLLSSGVRSGQRISLLFPKTKWAIISMLSVSKAGCSFTFLDLNHPHTRLKTIVDSINSSSILTLATEVRLAASLARNVICVDDSKDAWSRAANSDQRLPACLPTDDLYIVFTSGSTGGPKGALVTHNAFATRAMIAGPVLGLDQSPRVLQFTSFIFSASYRDILTTLIWGGCLCVPSEVDRQNNLSTFISSHNVTWAALTPSTLSILSPTRVPSLETVVATGEPLNSSLVQTWANRVQMMSIYGLSEGAGGNAVQQRLVKSMDPLNIGHAIAGCIWIVDPDNHDRLVPIGAVGEIVLEGPGLARGYINDRDRTKASFITSAAWFRKSRGVHHGCLYKTGDLGHYNAVDGTIVYAGRKDVTRVKVHGQLVDLLEVEMHLKRCLNYTQSTMTESVVVSVTPHMEKVPRTIACIEATAETTGSNEQRLILPATSVSPSWLELGNRLREFLPGFMIPFTFIPISALPSTSTGKRDRKMLQNAVAKMSLTELQAYNFLDQTIEQPAGESEMKLQTLWKVALDRDSVLISRGSNLFHLGGDSVTAMKLVGLARDAGLSLTVDMIFRFPVLSEQAEACSIDQVNDRLTGSGSIEYRPFSLTNQQSRDAIFAGLEQQCDVSANQVEDCYPCTALQMGMMAETLQSSCAYISQCVFRLRSDIKEDHYQATWREVIDANPALRTRMILTEDDCFQVVARGNHVIWKRRNDLARYLAEDKSEPMSPGSPLIRLALVHDDTSPDNTIYCVVSMHHAIYDLWSLRLIVAQVTKTYEHGTTPRKIDFAPFVRHVLQARHQSQLFWATKLQGCQAPLFPQIPSTCLKPMPRCLTHKVQMPFAPKSNVTATLATFARLAWAKTISNFTGSTEVVFGAVVSGRGADLAGVEGMTGPTIATLPVKIQLSPDTKVRDTLQNIQQDFLSTMPYEQLGLPEISKLGDEARLACQFQSLLVVQPDVEQNPADLMQRADVGGVDRLAVFGTYAITVLCQMPGSGASVETQILFDEQAVSLPYVQRCLEHFEHFFSIFTTNPDIKLAEVPSITPKDALDLTKWNGTLPDAAAHKSLQDIFSDISERQPDEEAICAWDGSITYNELQRCASHTAQRLVSHGISRGDIVPICMNKSRHVPAAMLAVTMVGASFTLLDPSHPTARLRTILKDIRATIILHNISRLDQDLSGANVQFIAADEFDSSNPRKDPAVATATSSPGDRLYIAWTSGSTGKPKGAMMSHSSFLTAVKAYQQSCEISQTSRVLQLCTYAFDVSILEIFAALLAGGCVCIPSEHSVQNRLTDVINELRVNWLTTTPTVARLLQPSELPSVKMCVLGGEAVSEDDIRTWQGHCGLVIAYGPAECSVCAATYRNPQEIDGGYIGTASGGVCWVVHPNDHEILMPIGAIGELIIEGPIVGLGYLNNVEKTDATFIEAPTWLHKFREETNGRLYKTGDLVRYRDGNLLQYVGRKDEQRKLNGMRIELAEVEYNVQRALTNTALQNLVVVAEIVNPPIGDDRSVLAAFVELDSASNLETPEDDTLWQQAEGLFMETCQKIRAKLLDRVPKHLVPTAFIPLKTLPQTLSQKVDRKRLRTMCSSIDKEEWQRFAASPADQARPPVTGREKLLSKLTRVILAIDDPEMGHTFLELGGDSIAAMRLSVMVRQHKLALTVADILSNEQLHSLAAKMQDISKDVQDLVPFGLLVGTERAVLLAMIRKTCNVSDDLIEDAYPTTPFQQDLIRDILSSPGTYLANFQFILPEGADVSIWREAWQATYNANPVLRTRIFKSGSRTFQAVLKGEFEWTASDHIHNAPAPLPGFGKPLSHLHVSPLPNGCIILSLRISHLLYDGWTLPLIVQQVEAAFLGHKLPLQRFAPFVEYLQNLDVSSGQDYWRSLLRGFKGEQFPILPTDDYMPLSTASVDRIIPINPFPVNDAAAIILAWAFATAHCARSLDVAFQLVSWGRDVPVQNIEQITGPTLSEFPFRLLFSRDASLSQMLQIVQDQRRRGLPYQNLGLRRISEVGMDAAAACGMSNFLVIHPPVSTGGQPSLLTSLPAKREDGQAFETVGVSLECFSLETELKARVQFDDRLITRKQVQEMLSHFENMLKLLQQKSLAESVQVGELL